jgi:hypothetical protein
MKLDHVTISAAAVLASHVAHHAPKASDFPAAAQVVLTAVA